LGRKQKGKGETNTIGEKEEKTATTSTSPGGFIFCAFLLYFMGPLDEKDGKRFQSGPANKTK
jgi:hypothetical protein